MSDISKKASIAVDLDGTLAEHTEWKGIEFIGKPIPAMMDRVKKWLDEGRSVVIFTARANMPGAIPYIQKWLKENGLPEDLKITNIKDSKMEQFWDDRAIHVERNTGKVNEKDIPAKKKADATNVPGQINDGREIELRTYGYSILHFSNLRDDRGYKKNPYEYEEFWYWLGAELYKDMRLRFQWGRAGYPSASKEKVIQLDQQTFDSMIKNQGSHYEGGEEGRKIVLEIAQREGIVGEYEKMRGVLVPGDTPEVVDQQTRRLERMLKRKISFEQEEDTLVKEADIQKVDKAPKSFLNHVLNAFHVNFEYDGKPIVMQVTLRKDPSTGDMRWDAIPFSMQEDSRENYNNLSPEQKVVIKKEAIDKALAENDPVDILDYEERFVYREALRQGMVTDVIDYWKNSLKMSAFLPEEAGRVSQNSLRKRIYLSWLQKSWVAPDGKVFPFTKEIHGQWAMENKDMLEKVYGIKASKYLLEDMMDNGWLRVSKDGIHFIDLDKSESAIDQFLKDNENDIPDELHIDVAKESFSIHKQDVMEYGIRYALGRSNKRPWWMERKDASLGKKASSVGIGWISPEGKFFPRVGGSHAEWFHQNRDITGIDFKDIPRDATLTDQQRDAVLKEALDRGWIAVSISGFYVNNMDHSQLKNIEDYVITNKDVMPSHFYLGYWGEKGSGKSDYLITKDVLEKGIESQIRVIKHASILDYPHPGLSPDVWDKENKLLPQHKERILKILMNSIQEQGWKSDPKTWITNIYIIGSLTSYQYSYKTDLDVHIHASLEDLNEQEFSNSISSNDLAEMLDLFRMDINAKKEVLPGTTHPIEFFFEAYLGRGMEKAQRNYIMKAQTPEGIYDLEKDEWLQPPRTVDVDFDPDEFVPSQTWKEINEIIEGLDVKIGKVERNLTSIDDLLDVIKSWDPENQKHFKLKMEERLRVINEEIDKIMATVQKVIDNRHIDYRPESNSNLTFKALQKFNYISIKKALETILETDGLITEKNIKELEKVLDNPEEVESQPSKSRKVKTDEPPKPDIPALASLEKIAIRPAFYLTDSHAQMVWRGEKELIVKARMFKRFIGEERYLASREKVYGIITLEQPEVVDLKEFGAREKEHRVTEEERERWWPTADHFYLYPFEFEPFRLPTGWEPIRKTRKKTTEDTEQPVGTATREGEKPKKEPSKENTDETSSTAKAGSKDPYKIDYAGNYCAMYDIRIIDSAHPLSPYDYHITHKFFGPLEPKTAKEIQDVIAQYWDTHPFKLMTLKFNREEFFGPDKDIHVLRISDESLTPQLEIPELRKQLDTYVKDTYEGGYKPHVTVPDEDIKEIEVQVVSYQFKCGDAVLQEWRQEEATGMIRTNLFTLDAEMKQHEGRRIIITVPEKEWHEYASSWTKGIPRTPAEWVEADLSKQAGEGVLSVNVIRNKGEGGDAILDIFISPEDTNSLESMLEKIKAWADGLSSYLVMNLPKESPTAQQKEWLAVTTPRAAQSLKKLSVLSIALSSSPRGEYRVAWIDPDGKEYMFNYGDSHEEWAWWNSAMLESDYGIEITEKMHENNLCSEALYDNGWFRQDSWWAYSLTQESAIKSLEDYIISHQDVISKKNFTITISFNKAESEVSLEGILKNGLKAEMDRHVSYNLTKNSVSSTRISLAYPTDLLIAVCDNGHSFDYISTPEKGMGYASCPICQISVSQDNILPFPSPISLDSPSHAELHEGRGNDTSGGKVGQTDVASESIRSQISKCQIAGKNALNREEGPCHEGVRGPDTTGRPSEGERPSSEAVGVSRGSQTREGWFMPSDGVTPPGGPIDFRTDPYINNPETEVFPYGKRPPTKLPLAPVKKKPQVRNPHHTQDAFPELQPYQPGMTVTRDKNDNPQSGHGDRESEESVVLDTTNMFELPLGDRGKNLSSPGMFPFWKRKKR